MRMHLLSIVASCFVLGIPANVVVQATTSMSQTRSVSLLSRRQDPIADKRLIMAASAHADAAKAIKEAADALRDTASNLKVTMRQLVDGAKNLPDEANLEMAVKTHIDQYNEELDKLRDTNARKVSKAVQDAKPSANGQHGGEQPMMPSSSNNVQAKASADEVGKAKEAEAASTQSAGAAGGIAKAAVEVRSSEHQSFAWTPIASGSASTSAQGLPAPVQFLRSFQPLRIRGPP